MTGDLVTGEAQVHDARGHDLQVHDAQVHDAQVHDGAHRILDFWFALTPEQHFAKDAALDRMLADRFSASRERVTTTRAAGWRDHPDTLLAAIILTDQVSRNIHRGSAEAFAHDDLAAELTIGGIAKGWEQRYPPARRVFFYMPLMHAEDAPLQDLSVDRFAALGIADNLAFARAHREVFLRFGRFPSRNAALGRASTPEEEAYLAQPGAGW